MNFQGKTLNFLGDSITEGGNATCLENVFVSVVQRNLQLAEARNYGVGGTCIAKRRSAYEEAELNKIWNEDFVTRAMRMKDADGVVVFGGTNDYGHGDVPIGLPTDCGETFCGALNKLFYVLQEKYSNKPIVFVTPTPRKDVCGPFGENRRDFATGTLADYVVAIKSVAKLHCIPVLDLFNDRDFSLESNFDVLISSDKLHPTDKGHAMIAQKIAEFLCKI